MRLPVFLALLCTVPTWAQTPSAPDTVVAWVRAHAIPLAGADPALPDNDLDALAPVLAGARVVGVGEGTHGTREFFQFRDRLVRWLAAQGELDAVLWETALAPTLAQEHLLTEPGGPYDFEDIFGGGLWNTEENRALLDALRAHNRRARRPARFLGADVSSLDVSLRVAAEAAQRVGARAAAPYAVMTEVLGADPGELCRDARACSQALFSLPAGQVRRFTEATDWLADELEAAGEPWTITIASRAPADFGRQFLPFVLMPGAPADTPVGLADRWAREARTRVRTAADTLAVLMAARDPDYWASVGTVVAAVTDGADVYRDSLGRAERFEWDHALRGLQARVATGRYGGDGTLADAAGALVAWLDAVHETLRRSPDHMSFDNYREVAMGRNVAEMGREIEGDGVVVYAAHNWHVGYNPSITLARKSSGAYTRDGLGDGYLAVGTFFGEGTFQAFDRSWRRGSDAPQWRAFETTPAAGSFEAMLMATGLDAFALDLRRLPASGPVAAWFAQARPTRNIGNSFTPKDPASETDSEYEDQVVADGFEVIVFFRRGSRAVPTEAEIARGSYDLGADQTPQQR